MGRRQVRNRQAMPSQVHPQDHRLDPRRLAREGRIHKLPRLQSASTQEPRRCSRRATRPSPELAFCRCMQDTDEQLGCYVQQGFRALRGRCHCRSQGCWTQGLNMKASFSNILIFFILPGTRIWEKISACFVLCICIPGHQ